MTAADVLQKAMDAALKARNQKNGLPVKRMEMSQANFDSVIAETGVLGHVPYIEIEAYGQVTVIAPSDDLKDNQFICEFDE